MKHALSLVAVLALTRVAHAECPTTPDDHVCRPWTALLLPTAFAVVYAPADARGPWVGGGLELVVAWSDNSPAFGPSQGKLRFGAAALRSVPGQGAGDAERTRTMATFRGGTQVSFERNASREFLIPYFSTDVGYTWSWADGRGMFVDGGSSVRL